MALTRKHFDATARLIRTEVEHIERQALVGAVSEPMLHTLWRTAVALADYYQTENPRFDRLKFMSASGLMD